MNTRIKIKKGLMPKAKKWYCSLCDGFTKTIKTRNRAIKCLNCGRKSLASYYDCPRCGAESSDDTLVKSSNLSIDYYGCYDWTETHKCWNCGTIYEFENSSC